MPRVHPQRSPCPNPPHTQPLHLSLPLVPLFLLPSVSLVLSVACSWATNLSRASINRAGLLPDPPATRPAARRIQEAAGGTTKTRDDAGGEKRRSKERKAMFDSSMIIDRSYYSTHVCSVLKRKKLQLEARDRDHAIAQILGLNLISIAISIASDARAFVNRFDDLY